MLSDLPWQRRINVETVFSSKKTRRFETYAVLILSVSSFELLYEPYRI